MSVLTKSLLIAAKAKITDPKRWTQGVFFRNAAGQHVDDVTEATCFCAAGALAAAINEARPDPRPRLALVDNDFQVAWEELNRVASRFSGGSYPVVQAVNDQGGHDATLRFFDYAIEVTDP